MATEMTKDNEVRKLHLILPTITRGNTFYGFTYQLEEEPTEVCMQLKWKKNKALLHTFDVRIDGTTCIVPDTLTGRSWPLGTIIFDIKIVFADGTIDTPVSGEFELEEDISRC